MAAKNSIDLLEVVKTLDKKLLPAVWCSFNSWKFPTDIEELSYLRPIMWEKMKRNEQMKILSPPQKYIESVIEPKEISREWNKERMTHKQFEEWWENTYQGRNTLIKRNPRREQIKKMFNKAMNIKQCVFH